MLAICSDRDEHKADSDGVGFAVCHLFGFIDKVAADGSNVDLICFFRMWILTVTGVRGILRLLSC
jgi:hypothetical protein